MTSVEPAADAVLVSNCLAGEREAFTQIVERYQRLLCSLAYSATGSLSESEDLAQEAFLDAWRQLHTLREPEKLRAWLCGILRYKVNRFRRSNRREPASHAEEIEQAVEMPSGDEPAARLAMHREEQSILWSALERVPEMYREPLVLYYREHRSIEHVAALLDLTEDAVKQRLARGRRVLQAQVLAFVEGALSRSTPGHKFTLAVLAALPSMATPAAAAVTGKGLATVGKSALGGLGLGAVLGPLIGLSIGWFSARFAASTARSPRERQCITRHAGRMVLFCFVMSLGLAAILSQAGRLYTASPWWVIVGIAVWLVVLLGTILWTSSRVNAAVLRIRSETGTGDAEYSAKLAAVGLELFQPIRYESGARLLGWPLFALRIGSLEAGSHRSHTARGWIAIGDAAISPLFAFGGIAIAPVAVGGLTVGLLSLSLWGAAIGALSFGSLSIGWWAFGIASIGWRAALGGGVALARDYAIGGWVQATEANTAAAKQWFSHQWFSPVMGFFAGHAHWIIVLAAVLSLAVVARRVWQLRRRLPSAA